MTAKSTPQHLKTLWSDLKALAVEENLVWRQLIKKDRLGAPVSFKAFKNPPYSAVYYLDRASYVMNGEKIWVHGIMKLRRGLFYLCK